MAQLIKYDAARKALQQCHRIDEVKNIRDKAEAMRTYAELAKDFDMQNMAAEIRLRAERRAGELLAEMKEKGERSTGRKNLRKGPESPQVTPELALSDLGITKKQSSTWQKVAAIPEAKFDAAIATSRERDHELTTAGILRIATKKNGASRTEASDSLVDADVLVARVMHAARLAVGEWPSSESYKTLILALRDYADVIERREMQRK